MEDFWEGDTFQTEDKFFQDVDWRLIGIAFLAALVIVFLAWRIG